MNYYLTPQEIAEALGLTELRKSTSGGLYLLSESDLVSYGIERAKEAGAIELSNNRHVTPAQEHAEEQENGQHTEDNPAEQEPGQESEVTQEENEETEAGNDENPEPESDGSAGGYEEQEDNNNENTEEE